MCLQKSMFIEDINSQNSLFNATCIILLYQPRENPPSVKFLLNIFQMLVYLKKCRTFAVF